MRYKKCFAFLTLVCNSYWLYFKYSDVKVPVPQPYEVIKKVPYEVKVEVPVPKPYTVIKKVPYEVKEYVDKVRNNKKS